MPHSHHSHSGQFCPGHAQNTLEEIVVQAIAKRLSVFAFTEHMPRDDEDRYPEEVEAGSDMAKAVLNELEYIKEALRLRKKYNDQIELLLGFESEWIRASSLPLISQSLRTGQFDFFVGSVHHVHTIPIDYDVATYRQARDLVGGTDEKLFESYFDSQLGLLQQTKPPIIGHFDLIRLKSDEPDKTLTDYPGVWDRVSRNLDFAASYGGILEINVASLRKGLKEPYPQAAVCKAFLERGGRFCLSDDSHGVQHVAQNYDQILPFLDQVGLQKIHRLRHSQDTPPRIIDERFPRLRVDEIPLAELRKQPFWHHNLP